jgi:hypothetical protein
LSAELWCDWVWEDERERWIRERDLALARFTPEVDLIEHPDPPD